MLDDLLALAAAHHDDAVLTRLGDLISAFRRWRQDYPAAAEVEP